MLCSAHYAHTLDITHRAPFSDTLFHSKISHLIAVALSRNLFLTQHDAEASRVFVAHCAATARLSQKRVLLRLQARVASALAAFAAAGVTTKNKKRKDVDAAKTSSSSSSSSSKADAKKPKHRK
jgi:hypothetical protein